MKIMFIKHVLFRGNITDIGTVAEIRKDEVEKYVKGGYAVEYSGAEQVEDKQTKTPETTPVTEKKKGFFK